MSLMTGANDQHSHEKIHCFSASAGFRFLQLIHTQTHLSSQFFKFNNHNNNVSKVIWHEAASQSCQPSRRRMHSALCALARHVTMGQCMSPFKSVPSHGESEPPCNTWFLAPTSQLPKWHPDQLSRFCTACPCAQHTDICRPNCVTSLATGHNCALHACNVA